jgi:hypothetical protein
MIGALTRWYQPRVMVAIDPNPLTGTTTLTFLHEGDRVIFRGMVDTTNIEGDLEGDAPRLASRLSVFALVNTALEWLRRVFGLEEGRCATRTKRSQPTGMLLLQSPRNRRRLLTTPVRTERLLLSP